MSDEEHAGEEAAQELRDMIGKPIGAPSVAPDPVNQPMIRHWAAAFEDHNPVYTDPRVRGGVALRRHRRAAADAADVDHADAEDHRHRRARRLAGRGRRRTRSTPLDEAGFIATLATNSEFEIVRYLRLGEVVTSTMVIESVSDEKQTRIGPGHFITWVTTYRDERGEVVGRQTFRILKFKPDLEALLT